MLLATLVLGAGCKRHVPPPELPADVTLPVARNFTPWDPSIPAVIIGRQALRFSARADALRGDWLADLPADASKGLAAKDKVGGPNDLRIQPLV
jgi:hypothetical protein